MSRRKWYAISLLFIVHPRKFLLIAFLKDRGEEAQQSFGKYLIERQNELELSDEEMAYLAGSMFGAGSDTTASAISIAVMAAACYPEAQAKVQEELDTVIGRERGGYQLA